MQVERPFEDLQSNLLLRAGSSVSSDQVTRGFAQSGLRNSEDGDGTASAGNLFLNSRKFKRSRVFQLAWEDMRMFQAVSQTTLAKSRLNKTNINSLNKIIVCFKGTGLSYRI